MKTAAKVRACHWEPTLQRLEDISFCSAFGVTFFVIVGLRTPTLSLSKLSNIRAPLPFASFSTFSTLRCTCTRQAVYLVSKIGGGSFFFIEQLIRLCDRTTITFRIGFTN